MVVIVLFAGTLAFARRFGPATPVESRSPESRHGRPPSRPMTPFSATATIRAMVILSDTAPGSASDGDGRRDMRVEPVPVEREIVVSESEYVGHVGVQRHRRQSIGLPLQLGIGLFDVICI